MKTFEHKSIDNSDGIENISRLKNNNNSHKRKVQFERETDNFSHELYRILSIDNNNKSTIVKFG